MWWWIFYFLAYAMMFLWYQLIKEPIIFFLWEHGMKLKSINQRCRGCIILAKILDCICLYSDVSPYLSSLHLFLFLTAYWCLNVKRGKVEPSLTNITDCAAGCHQLHVDAFYQWSALCISVERSFHLLMHIFIVNP